MIEIVIGPGRADRISAQERAVIAVGIRTEPMREQVDPGVVHRRRQRERQEKARGLCALGGEVGQIHPQRLLRHHVGGVLGEEMHAADDGVGGQHQLLVGREIKRRGVVSEIEGAGVLHKRPEKMGDQAIFRGLVR